MMLLLVLLGFVVMFWLTVAELLSVVVSVLEGNLFLWFASVSAFMTTATFTLQCLDKLTGF